MKPRKKRDVLYPPGAFFFKPQGIPVPFLDITSLTIDEYEAVRLCDHDNLKHEEASKKMNISRPTFTRLLESAHSKISDAIVNGKAIRIEGGDYRFLKSRFRCRKCGSFWNAEEKMEKKVLEACPKCESGEVEDVAERFSAGITRHGKNRMGHGWHKKGQEGQR